MSDKWKQMSQEEFSGLMRSLEGYSVKKDWASIDAMFEDDAKYMRTTLGLSLIVQSRYYDHWLTTRQDFINRYQKNEEIECISYIESCRFYEHDPKAPAFWFEATAPKGLLKNPELGEELEAKPVNQGSAYDLYKRGFENGS